MEKDDDGMLTREEKEALLDRKIQMMKLKNEERMKKFKVSDRYYDPCSMFHSVAVYYVCQSFMFVNADKFFRLIQVVILASLLFVRTSCSIINKKKDFLASAVCLLDSLQDI